MRLNDLIDESVALRGVTLDVDTHLHRVTAIAVELAAHVECPPIGLTWWAAAVGGPVGGSEPPWWTLRDLARESMVPYGNLYAGRLSQEQGDRCALLVDRERERVYGRLLRWVSREVADTLETLERAAEAAIINVSTLLPNVRAQAVAIEAASRPLHIVTEHTQAGGGPTTVAQAGERRQAESFYGTYQCSRCAHLWRPRVQHPVRCPRCQAPLRWTETATTVQENR